ncbi:hypothetical protein CHU92_02705 [Flavobacterium cyanobacteriorum]|uniref:Uncharacterized protein n=1 Tax=Flavobacterium cyanobacteriorum TaxID=2022802 RepID=A0A255ZTC1_9FLAO|nr:hypothetical protein [Flavobacterium cyanobacteriorum]OYQ43970.1 hypothetical protein CHU92_02705 [Flavobacterium cyanobacteriorum]
MRMLKNTFLLFAILLANSTFSQTREETIEWLNINGKSLSSMSFKNEGNVQVIFKLEEITTDSLRFYTNVVGTDGTHNPWIVSVLIKDILYEEITKIEKYKGWTNAFLIKLSLKNKSIHVPIENGDEQWSKKEIKEREDITFYYTNEENAKRVIKAIMHLAKLSGAKENKQTF